MALDTTCSRILDNVLRSLSTAARSLRLYPPTSTIPREAVDSALAAFDEYFTHQPGTLSLSVAREGFAFDGEPVGATIAVSLELADTLRDNGVAQIDIAQEVTPEDLLDFLSVVALSGAELRAKGGLSAALDERSVRTITLTDVRLVTMDPSLADAMDSRTRMREIADSPDKLGEWFNDVSSTDVETFRSSLSEFVELGGPKGAQSLADVLSGSVSKQKPEGLDALLALALDPGPAREITGQMFGKMDAPEIASSILDSKFGRNMLALSSALSNLPLDDVADSVRQEVLDMLPVAGHGPSETAFLDHMLEVRSSSDPEPALVETDFTFRTIAQAGSVSDVDVSRAREVTTAAASVLDVVGARTMLSLLDAQTEYEAYCSGVDKVAAMASKLLERGDFALAAKLLGELALRATLHPEWSGLPEHVSRALADAVGSESASTLIRTCMEEPGKIAPAKEIVRYYDASCQSALATEAIALKAPGLAVADVLLGKRLVDLLYALAPQAQWFQVGPVVQRFAKDGSQRSVSAIEGLFARPEDQARREVIGAISNTTNPALLPLLGSALRDCSEEVAALAARAIARSGMPGSATLLAARLAELDVDNADFARARELIGALARTPDPAADEALQRLASRRALIKRGHFVEIQKLVAQALAVRQRESER